jgi:trimethylamine---corrinoid protein Co-methyltransferase
MRFQDFKVLSDQEIVQIHEASITLLENTGVMIHSKKALDILNSKGAVVDYDKKLVKISGKMVESCLKTIPKTIDLYDRNGNKYLTLGDGVPKCASGHNAIFIIDAETNERRNSTVRDVEDFAIISDKLADIDVVGVPAMTQDVTPQATLLYAVRALYKNTTKPLFFSTESSAINSSIIDMMKVIAGKNLISECPTAISQLSSTSPLLWEPGAVDALIDVASEGVPLNLLPEPMTGVSAPYTVAGLLTMHNTEILSGIVISQLVRPGTPVIYGSSWTTFDMKYTSAIIGSPETSILRVAGCQMARYYNMPSHTTAPNSDSNAHDEQNSWEKTISNMCAICGGNDLVMNSGMFATGLTISLEQLVLDDEINGIIRRLHRGIDVNPETIGVKVINSVGPKGSFLMEDHTMEFLLNGEFREVKVSNTMNYDNWLAAGGLRVEQNASKIVKNYLDEGNRNVLERDIIEKFDRIIKIFESGIK